MSTPKTFKQFKADPAVKQRIANEVDSIDFLMQLAFEAGDGSGFERGYQAGLKAKTKHPTATTRAARRRGDRKADR